ncbi:hypothetical protein SADUNF_Sadunf14G0082200 [Salix dunnii]|uniref:Ribosomal protein eL8/eL30/eS12/Gadd45 domain-containing protein n=1 Tax=Salix dunnii TaxID=1413687 RepID=A0A835JGW0_9ROSI|nr:hypothetical protein SADUNF_Sadunf14G0082200 [Salix dunnii]
MVEKTNGRKEEVVSREYTINLHKRLHGWEIESTKTLDENSLPEKFWFKQQFAIGVNEVTRVLERMSPVSESGRSLQQSHVMCTNHKIPSVHLQAILIASDCNPKWPAKHLPSLASSRKVPLIFVKDKRGGSLRLGELVKLKTAIAIGVKDDEQGWQSLYVFAEETLQQASLGHVAYYFSRRLLPFVGHVNMSSVKSIYKRFRRHFECTSRLSSRYGSFMYMSSFIHVSFRSYTFMLCSLFQHLSLALTHAGTVTSDQ